MTQYYVRKDGNDGNTGTADSAGGAWLTINKAGTVLVAGDTVTVGDGTYNETVLLSTNSGNAGAKITYQSKNYLGAKVVSPGTGTSSAFRTTKDYIVVRGFDVTGGGAVGIDMAHSFGEVYLNYVHDIPVLGSIGFGGAGIAFSEYGFTNGIADSNIVARIGTFRNTNSSDNNKQQGLYPSIPFCTFTNNIVYGVNAYGFNSGHFATNCVIKNNAFFNNGNSFLDSGGIVITATDSGNVSDHHRIRNNIIFNNLGTGIHEEGTQGSDIIYSNNCVFGNNTAFGALNGHSNTNNVIANPLFVNYQPNGSGDYHSNPSSPCINTGLDTSEPLFDFDGVARPQGVTVDIGPYEWLVAATNKAFYIYSCLG
jgi:hypothetical protein